MSILDPTQLPEESEYVKPQVHLVNPDHYEEDTKYVEIDKLGGRKYVTDIIDQAKRQKRCIFMI